MLNPLRLSNAAFNRRDSGGRCLIDTEDVKEVLRDLGVVREVGWLLDQFDVRWSTMHPYNQVLQLVKDVMSSAPSSATGQPYSATGHGQELRYFRVGENKKGGCRTLTIGPLPCLCSGGCGHL